MEEVDRQVIKSWGNNKALRITKKSGLSEILGEGSHVAIYRATGGVFIELLEESPKESLAERLARFDVTRHRGEMMATSPVGAEIVGD